MGGKAMGTGEWTKPIQTCKVRFCSSLDFWSVSKIFIFACVSDPRTSRSHIEDSYFLRFNLYPLILAMCSTC